MDVFPEKFNVGCFSGKVLIFLNMFSGKCLIHFQDVLMFSEDVYSV